MLSKFSLSLTAAFEDKNEVCFSKRYFTDLRNFMRKKFELMIILK